MIKPESYITTNYLNLNPNNVEGEIHKHVKPLIIKLFRVNEPPTLFSNEFTRGMYAQPPCTEPCRISHCAKRSLLDSWVSRVFIMQSNSRIDGELLAQIANHIAVRPYLPLLQTLKFNQKMVSEVQKWPAVT